MNRVFDNRIVEVTYSRLAPKHKLQAWISLVTLAAGKPGPDWTAICVGRGDKDTVAVCCLRTPPDPRAVLTEWGIPAAEAEAAHAGGILV